MNEDKLVQPTNCACGSIKSEGPTLVFACSGAADVGGVSDQAARKLSAEGTGKMFCLAAIGGGIQSYLESTDKAGKILAIDGCSVGCAKHVLEEAGFMEFKHIRLTDLGLVKGKTGITPEAIEIVAQAGRNALSEKG